MVLVRICATSMVLFVLFGCSDNASCGTSCVEAGSLSLLTTIAPPDPRFRGAELVVSAVAQATAPARVDSLVGFVDGVRIDVQRGASGSFSVRPTVVGDHKARVIVYGTGATNSPLLGPEVTFTVITGPNLPPL